MKAVSIMTNSVYAARASRVQVSLLNRLVGRATRLGHASANALGRMKGT